MAGYVCARAGDRTSALQLLDRIADLELEDDEREFRHGIIRAIKNEDDLESYLHAMSRLEKSAH
jgi:hypothetical protein